MHVHLGRIPLEATEEISLFLAVTAVLTEFFSASGVWIEIAVAFATIDHLVMPCLQPDFFADLAEQCFLMSFTSIDPTLWKLPGTRNRPALANQQISRRIHDQRSDIWTVTNHGFLDAASCPV